MNATVGGDRGFSLIELIAVAALIAIVGAMAVPQMVDIAAAMRLNQATRELERELQTARLKAVSSNRWLRVRLNCPAAGSYRIVEFLGTAADTSADRCRESVYPYPAPDNDPLTRPNSDGALRMLHPEVTVPTMAIEFRSDGTAWTVDGAGALQAIPLAGVNVTLTRKTKTRQINVNALGKIAIQ